MKKEKSVMDIVARYVHGSEDSTDLDVLYIADRIPETKVCPHRAPNRIRCKAQNSAGGGSQAARLDHQYFPSLRPYLYREACRMDELEDMKQRFLDVMTAKGFEDCGDMTVRIPGPPDRYIDLKGKEHDIASE